MSIRRASIKTTWVDIYLVFIKAARVNALYLKST